MKLKSLENMAENHKKIRNTALRIVDLYWKMSAECTIIW